MTTYFDIETRPCTPAECEPFLKPIPEFDAEACRREFSTAREDSPKGREFLAKKEQEHYAKAKAARDEFIAKAALRPETGSVIAIGLCYGDSDEVIVLSGDESEILRNFWQVYLRCATSGHRMVGWNSNDFDVPFCVKRSWKLGVRIPGNLFGDTGRLDRTFVDLMKSYCCGVYGERVSLDTASKHILGKGKSDQEVTGADFWKFWQGTPDEQSLARQYLTNDVLLVKGLGEVML